MHEHQASRFLLAILADRRDDALELAGSMEQGQGFSGFAEFCNRCDVAAWTHFALDRAGMLEAVGQEEAGRLKAFRLRTRKDNLFLLALAEQALDLLANAGIQPVALKGFDTLHRFYPMFDTRDLDDVDLLVRREELIPALEAFDQAGWVMPPEPQRTRYIRSSHHLPFRSPGRLPVDFELHWNLAQEQRFSIDPAGLIDRAKPLEVEGRTLLRLDDADLVAHLLVHHLSHYFDRRLKWLVDLQFVTSQPGFDWAQVAERIHEWGAGAAAGSSLAHLHKLWPELIPDQALRRMPFSWWRRALTAPIRSGHPLEMFRGTRNRRIQLYLASVMLENPLDLPAWLAHRSTRDSRPSENPLDRGASG